MDGQQDLEKAQDDAMMPGRGFLLAHQKVELDLDFSQCVTGKTEITVYPKSPNVKSISLSSRQCRLKNVLINGLRPSSISHQDPCSQLQLHFAAGPHQHHVLAKKISKSCQAIPEADLVLGLPKNLKIQKVDLAEVHQNGSIIKINHPEADGKDATETTQGLTDTSVAEYTPIVISIDFITEHVTEAIQFVSGNSGSGKWPHLYTRGKIEGASASALFPCVDSLKARCTWDITLTCPRTVGDAIVQRSVEDLVERLSLMEKARKQSRPPHEMKEMFIVCSGKLIDENIVRDNSTKKTATFSCSQQLSARQIGFAIGPFERVNLSALREADEIAKLGDNAVDILAYCLPLRKEETKNTCLPLTLAVDSFVQKYSPFPAQSFSLCFVEETGREIAPFAHTAMCSTKLLYPEDVIDPAREVTRKLVHTLAYQWSGINIIPEMPSDTWAVVGIAHFMTDLFMKDLCGNNEYRYRMRLQADQVYELDRERPSIYDMGNYLHIDPSEYHFISLKAPVVLFILDRRMAKSAGTSKMHNIIGRICQRSRMGELENNALGTDFFQRTIEKFAHFSITEFMDQWVRGAGCPRFEARQRFNKKKLVIEMQIKQTHGIDGPRDLNPDNFVRDVREDWEEVFAGEFQAAFTGPMTIRIHEADGTPYEHIVQIKEGVTNIDIPYNTKYKRLKRSKQQRKNPAARTDAEGADDENDALVYCLGDTLQSEEEMRDWRITEWSKEDEDKMNAESYEWIRLDADFEWIARIVVHVNGYMFSSQLQQDRDVVAQVHAVKAIEGYTAQPLVSSILVRTLMDRRYFYGVRQLAAQALVQHAGEEVDQIGLFHLQKAFEAMYCLTDSGSSMTRPNDFSNPQAYLIQCSIIEAFSRVRDTRGFTPKRVKEFLLDKLKYNDNSNNDYSDAFYIATIMKALTTALIARSKRRLDADDMQIDEANELTEMYQFEKQCLEEIDRYRRMDEWTSSYQNLYCRTALQCQAQLAEAGIGTFSPLHFMQYTRPGNYDLLRLDAYKILIQPNILEEPLIAVMEYIINCMVVSSSPYLRQGIQAAFGRVLAKRAIGIKTSDSQSVPDGLVMEETNLEATAAFEAQERARRKSVEAAQEALATELGEHEQLGKALWKAVTYSQITLEDLSVMLDFCRMIFAPINQAKVGLRYPRYWRMRNLGKGKLKFMQTGAVRTKMMVKWEPPKSVAPAVQPPVRSASIGGSGLKLKLTNKAMVQAKSPSVSTPTSSPALQTPPPQTQPSQPPQPGRVVLKFGRSNVHKG